MLFQIVTFITTNVVHNSPPSGARSEGTGRCLCGVGPLNRASPVCPGAGERAAESKCECAPIGAVWVKSTSRERNSTTPTCVERTCVEQIWAGLRSGARMLKVLTCAKRLVSSRSSSPSFADDAAYLSERWAEIAEPYLGCDGVEA
jgi:hypothetical protein